jgi:hypothetical protein
MLVTDEDQQWLSANFPGLNYEHSDVSGTIDFIASHDTATNRLRIFERNEEPAPDEVFLRGSFEIVITERKEKHLSMLPLLKVSGVDPIPSRHFNQNDKSACLCSPLEEGVFLFPELSLPKFIRHLVIPFLYGQVFYSNYGKWPWKEYAHGAAGLLESYSEINNSSKLQECLDKLSKQEKPTWERIKQALGQKSEIKGHTTCFCQKMGHIRSCHPDAWEGIKKLHNDIKSQHIFINS